MDKKDEKSIRQIRIRHSDLNRNDPDPFFRYWIKLYDLAGPVRDELHPGYHIDVATNMGIKTSIQDFLILENDGKSLVMGVQWHTSLVGEQCGDSVPMVNIDTFGTKLSNSLESTEDKAEEDKLLDDSTTEVYPESKIEGVDPHNQFIRP